MKDGDGHKGRGGGVKIGGRLLLLAEMNRG